MDLSRLFIVSATFAALAPQLFSQSVVIPAVAAQSEGNDGQNRLFENSPFRAQQVVLGTALGVTPGQTMQITSIGYRADSNFSRGIPDPAGATFSDVVINLYTTSQTPGQVDANFATNLALSTEALPAVDDYDIVGNGDPAITFPQWIAPGPGGVAPFTDILFAVPIPFTPTTSEPNLLIDITSAIAPGVSISIDGSRAGGHYFEFGTSSAVGMPDPFAPFRLQVNGNSTTGSSGGNRAGLAVGDAYSMFCGVPSYLGFAPATFIGGVGTPPAPIDLSIVGVPGASLYTTGEFSFPGRWQNSPISGAQLVATIPLAARTPIGIRWQAQVALLDPTLPNNQLQVALSNAVDMTIGDTGPNHPLGQVAASDTSNPNGFVQYGGSAGIWGGAVLNVGHQ